MHFQYLDIGYFEYRNCTDQNKHKMLGKMTKMVKCHFLRLERLVYLCV